MISLCGVLFALTLVSVFQLKFYFFDEPIYIDAAQSIFDGQEVSNWEHPPLGKYFIQAGRMAMEDRVTGARLPAVVALLVVLTFIGLTAERLFRGRVAAGLPGSLAVLLVLTDPLVLNLSKIAMLEIFVLAFTVAGLYVTLCWLDERRPRYLFWLGLSCGLAVATKWSAIPVFAVFFLAVLIQEWKRGVLALILAGGIYILSYVPFFFLLEPKITFTDLLSLHKTMWRFHTTFRYEFNHQSPWYSWPILFRPIWLVMETGHGTIQGLFTIGNLVTYLLGPVGLVWYAWRRPSRTSFFLLAGYLSTLVFWSVSGRRTYFYYYMMCSPFIYLGTLVLLWQAYKRQPVLAYGVSAAVVGIFAVYYPLVSYDSVSMSYVRAVLFLPSWRYVFGH